MSRRTRAASLVLPLAVVALCLGAYALYWRTGADPDPDRWFHFAVSRAMSESGVLRSLPQAEDLGWDSRFTEPYFLFHALTATGFRLGGETGVVLACAGLMVTIFLLLFTTACAWAPAGLAAGLTCAALLTSSYLTPRLFQVRPHLVGIACATLLTAGLARRRSALVFVGAMTFALGYHAYYIPAALIVAAAVTTRGPDRRAILLAGFGGLALGIVGNPYFPSNVTGAWEQLRIAFWSDTGEPGMEVGSELARLPLPFLLKTFSFSLALLAAAGWGWHRTRPEARPVPSFLLLSALAFWALALRSPRASEYAVPLTVLAAAAAYPALRPELRRHAVATGAVALAIVLLGGGGFLRSLAGPPAAPVSEPRTRAALAALSRIPPEAAGEKVANCNWTLGGFVYYARPDLRFIDTLHPLLLRFAAPEKYALLRNLKQGLETDAAGRFSGDFRARYVLCDLPLLNEALGTDPRVTTLFHDPRTATALFRLDPVAPAALVTTFVGALVPGPVDVADHSIARRFPKAGEPIAGPVANLDSRFGLGDGTATRCAWLTPSPGQLAAHAGARSVTVGGGPHVRLWLNRRLLYSSDPFLGFAKISQKTLALPRRLRASDRLEAAVCQRSARYWAFALQLR